MSLSLAKKPLVGNPRLRKLAALRPCGLSATREKRGCPRQVARGGQVAKPVARFLLRLTVRAGFLPHLVPRAGPGSLAPGRGRRGCLIAKALARFLRGAAAVAPVPASCARSEVGTAGISRADN